MKYEIEVTDQFNEWWDTLDESQQEALNDRIKMVGEYGPTLSGGIVKTIRMSERDLREIRTSSGGVLRVLFAFDPRQNTILLLGGNKTGSWNKWYETAVPEADALYDVYLQELRDEGLLD